MKKFGKKIILYTSVLSMLSFGSACTHYHKTTPPNIVYNLKPINPTVKETEEIDYSKLTWQEAIAYVKTPEQAQDYLYTHFEYDFDEYNGFSFFGIFNVSTKGETFKYNHTRRKGICIDYATAAASLLSDDGYPPLLLYMKKGESRHVVFLYKTEEGFGALSNNFEKPIHQTIESLVKSIRQYYPYEHYAVVNLDENYKNREWIDGDVDLQGARISNWTKIKGNLIICPDCKNHFIYK